ncbi:hypothetical protein Taro_042725 [Colocasia esculenta]|uniref:F-box/LRR-repeat protein 15-like leucin rich repeat domain-containing protein n=1 Tax=Colocasia esculenta TaxID=4460 RepID=A0A843WJ48_COLES|nr:hypothetical protein [Colocasia esculenta]
MHPGCCCCLPPPLLPFVFVLLTTLCGFSSVVALVVDRRQAACRRSSTAEWNYVLNIQQKPSHHPCIVGPSPEVDHLGGPILFSYIFMLLVLNVPTIRDGGAGMRVIIGDNGHCCQDTLGGSRPCRQDVLATIDPVARTILAIVILVARTIPSTDCSHFVLGDDDIHHGGRLFSGLMDSSCYLSLSRVDVYCPPLKRARVNAPFIPQGWENWENPTKLACSIDALPDECLFEILRRVEGKRERSISACVSKRWLMLLSSIRKCDVSSSSPSSISKADASCDHRKKPLPDLNESSVDEDLQEEEPVLFEEDAKCPSKCLEGKEATDTRLVAMAVGTGNRGGLGELLIRGCNNSRPVTDVGLGAIARGSPSLRVLSLWNSPSITDEGLTEIANCCPLLEKLDICKCPLISDKGITAIANKCPNLSSLTIESCQKIGDGGLQAIGRCCQNLWSVSVADLGLVGDQGIASLVSSTSSSLQKIRLQHLKITDASLAVIGLYGKEVADLVFANLPNISEKGFWVMGSGRGLQKLRSLIVISCGVTDVGLKAVAEGCPQLKKLCLRKSTYLSDAGLNGLLAAAGALENLQLEECNRISLVGIFGAILNGNAKLRSLELARCMGIKDISTYPASVPACCLPLQSLSISHCPGFGNTSVSLVGKLCPKLQYISLIGLVGLSDAGLLPLIEGCDQGLAKVSLDGCINITDAAVSALAKRHGRTLQTLSLEGCRKVTDESLLAIADSCFLLDDLDVSKSAITDEGVAALASSIGINLQVLSLSGCSKISARSLQHLKNLGHSLVGLNLQVCNLISAHAITSFQKKMWQCDILS